MIALESSRWRGFGSGLICLLAAGCASSAGPRESLGHSRPALGGWVTHWNFDRGMDSVRRADGALGDVMFFVANLDADGHPRLAVNPVDLEGAMREVERRGGRAWLTAVNDVVVPEGRAELKASDVVVRMMRDDAARARHVDALVELTSRFDAHGLDLDYENLPADARDDFTRFVGDLRERTRAARLRLSVTIQPKTREKRSTGPGAADWSALCARSDRLQIMLYNLHNARTGPGPVAESGWIDEVLDFAESECSADAVVPVLKFGGFEWGDSGVRDAMFERVHARVREGGAVERWDRRAESPYATWTENGAARIAYYEDARSFDRKLRRLAARGVAHTMIWSLGVEDPALWSRISTGP